MAAFIIGDSGENPELFRTDLNMNSCSWFKFGQKPKK
jgi:hypothetical protein